MDEGMRDGRTGYERDKRNSLDVCMYRYICVHVYVCMDGMDGCVDGWMMYVSMYDNMNMKHKV